MTKSNLSVVESINKEHDYFSNRIQPQKVSSVDNLSNMAEIHQIVNEICEMVDSQLLIEKFNKEGSNMDANEKSINPDEDASNEFMFQDNDFVASLIEVVDNIHSSREANQPIIISSSSESESSSESGSDTDESDWIPPKTNEIDFKQNKNVHPKSKQDKNLNLPQIKNLEVHLPENAELVAVGRIMSIIDKQLVVIKSHPDQPALDMDSVLFFDHNTAIGMIDETFGPVSNPHYVIRFNDEAHLLDKGVEVNREVFFAPNMEKYTTFIFMNQLRKIRGSDASWKNNEEPPPEHIDYSDDEQERSAKNKKRNRKRKPQESTNRPALGCTNRMRGDRWHNQQTRYQVPDDFDSLVGWHNAVNSRQQTNPRLQHTSNSNPPPIHTLFQTPPPPSPQHMSPGFPIPPAFHQRPPPNFTPFANPNFPAYLWNNGPPPPPPPDI